jgi:hypothetical protein
MKVLLVDDCAAKLQIRFEGFAAEMFYATKKFKSNEDWCNHCLTVGKIS